MKVCRSVLFAVLVAHHVDHFRCQVGLSDAVQARDKAFQWLVDQADAEVGGWQDEQRARIVTALQLYDHGWLFDAANPLALPALHKMNKDIVDRLAKSNNMQTMSGEDAGEIVNAVLATCQDPRDFYGRNLVDMLRKKIDLIPSGGTTKNVMQVVASVAALCNANADVPLSAVQRINSEMKPKSGPCPYCVEGSSLAVITMKCLRSQMPNEPLVQGITTRQAAYVKGKQVADGGLGNFVGTALATQAANAVGTVNLPINVAASLAYLIADQDEAGSFGNVDLNALVLPTLIGRSIIDVKTIIAQCPGQDKVKALIRQADPSLPLAAGGARLVAAPPLAAGQVRLQLTVEDDVHARRGLDTVIETRAGNTILQVMNQWSAKHPRAFQFKTEVVNGATVLTGVNSVGNDAKNGRSWRTLHKPSGVGVEKPTTAGLDKVRVAADDAIIFRYEASK